MPWPRGHSFAARQSPASREPCSVFQRPFPPAKSVFVASREGDERCDERPSFALMTLVPMQCGAAQWPQTSTPKLTGNGTLRPFRPITTTGRKTRSLGYRQRRLTSTVASLPDIWQWTPGITFVDDAITEFSSWPKSPGPPRGAYTLKGIFISGSINGADWCDDGVSQ